MSNRLIKDYEKAFQDGIKMFDLDFFNKLKEHCQLRYSYNKNQLDALIKTLDNMKSYGSHSKNNLYALTLQKSLEFGLKYFPEIVEQIGNVSFTLTKRASELPQVIDEDENRRESYAYTVATSLSDDYAEDFEVDDESDTTNFKSNKSNNWNDSSNTITTAFDYVETIPRTRSPMYMSKENDLHEQDSEIEDETSMPVNSPPTHLSNKYRAESKHNDSDDDNRYVNNRISNNRYESKHDNMIKSTPILPNNSYNIIQPKISLREPSRNPSVYNDEKGISDRQVSRSSHKKHHKNKTASWIINHKWNLGDKIGHGSFGAVYQGMNDKGELFAVKTLQITGKDSEVDKLAEEIELMSDLSHPNIVEYLGTWIDEDKGMVYIFQEWVPGGSIAHILKKFGPLSEDVIRNYTRQILQGLKYLHENNIVHRDIKGGNILVDLGTVKLADFGASKKSDFEGTQATTTIRGTPYFMAPEVLSENRYGRKGDIWAVGCTIIQMLTGEPPWKDQNLSNLVQLHMLLTTWNKGIPPFKANISKNCRDFLELCFQKDESKRPYTTTLIDHIFLRDDDFDVSIVDIPQSHNRNSYVSHRKHQSNHNDSDNENLEDSIRTKLGRAVSRASITMDHMSISSSNTTNTNNNTNTEDDTFAKIDKKILQNNKYPNNNRYGINKPSLKVDSPPIYSPASDISAPSSSNNNPFAKGKTSISKDIVERASINAFTPPTYRQKYIQNEDDDEEELKVHDNNDVDRFIEKPIINTSYKYPTNINASQSQSSARDSEILTPLSNDDNNNNQSTKIFPKKIDNEMPLSNSSIKGISSSVKRAVAINESNRQSLKIERKNSTPLIDKGPITKPIIRGIRPIQIPSSINNNNMQDNTNDIDLSDWKCLNPKCNSINGYQEDYCTRCAVVRGGTGSRSLHEYVPIRRS